MIKHVSSSTHLCIRFASAERVGQGEVGGRAACTWWLLGLAVKGLWLGLGGPILALDAWTGLENTTLRGFISGKESCLGLSRCMTTESAD